MISTFESLKLTSLGLDLTIKGGGREMDKNTNTCVYKAAALREAGGPISEAFENPQTLKFGAAVVYDYKSDLYYFAQRKDLGFLKKTLISRKRVVGFNNIRIDNRLVFAPKDDLPDSYDILQKIISAKDKSVKSHEEGLVEEDMASLYQICIKVRALSDPISWATLWARAIEEKDWSQVFFYLLRAVRGIKSLYEQILKTGYLSIEGKKVMIEKETKEKGNGKNTESKGPGGTRS